MIEVVAFCVYHHAYSFDKVDLLLHLKLLMSNVFDDGLVRRDFVEI
jgi:hypothetical protein